MDQIERDVRAAKELGFPSYGYYIASKYDPFVPMGSPKPSRKRRRNRRYTDEQLFLLWQEGKSDSEIGAAVGVSRQFIQQWRDQLELPSTYQSIVNTQKYRLTRLPDGTYIVILNDEL